MEQVIKLARRNGWVAPSSYDVLHDDKGKWGYEDNLSIDFAPTLNDMPLAGIFLDPRFWQSLGKALGWRGEPIFPLDILDRKTFEKNNPQTWQTEWHRFIDHLADGKDAESFFKELLTN